MPEYEVNLAAEVRQQYDIGQITREMCNFKLECLLAAASITPSQFGEAWVKQCTRPLVKPERKESGEALDSMGLF